MKQIISKRLVIAAFALLTVPGTLLAQKEKEEKEKDKSEKKDMQHINIIRHGNSEEPLVIEIKGDKVTINGKDSRDVKDVTVNTHTMKDYRSLARTRVAQGGWNMDFDGERFDIFNEDENRAMLGVNTEDADDDGGAVVKVITRESGADKAGLKKGDVLKKIGDKKIEDADDVTSAVRAHKPGEKVDIVYERDGKEQRVTAELGKWKGIRSATVMPSIREMQPAVPAPGQFEHLDTYGGSIYFNTGRPKLGLSIQDTDDGVGVKVLEVDEDSHAGKAGIEEGDVIVGIDDKEIRSTDEVTRIIRTAPKDKYTFHFRVQRDGRTKNIEVKMPRKLKTADL